MSKDPLIKEARKAYRESDVARVDKLMEEQSRWRRKVTIAENKLAQVRNSIDKLLREVTTPPGEKGADERD